MSVDIGICSFQKDCTHLYICMLLFLVCIKKKKDRFLLHKMDYILDTFLQNGHCGPVFYCVAYKCIWLSYKCIYIKVHLMRLMKLCHHIWAPGSSLVIIIIIIGIIVTVPASSLHALFHFFPWSYFRSATALTHTHDETEWDTIWLTLTHTLGIEGFFFFPACACAQLDSHFGWCTYTHNSRHMPPPPQQPPPQLFTNHSCPLVYLQRCLWVWRKTPYIGIPVWEHRLKQPPVYPQPPFRKIIEGRGGEGEEAEEGWGDAKMGTVKMHVRQPGANQKYKRKEQIRLDVRCQGEIFFLHVFKCHLPYSLFSSVLHVVCKH